MVLYQKKKHSSIKISVTKEDEYKRYRKQVIN